MDWESSDVVGFDLGPLLQGHMRIAKLKSTYNVHFLLGIHIWPMCIIPLCGMAWDIVCWM